VLSFKLLPSPSPSPVPSHSAEAKNRRNCSKSLTEKEIDSIRKETETCFGEASKVFLFGSRTNDNKKGGDIDLYVQPEKQDDLFNKKVRMLTILYETIGEQKIDIIVQYQGQKRLIDEIALKEGILL
jgi:predicted nucleotidyltransferase